MRAAELGLSSICVWVQLAPLPLLIGYMLTATAADANVTVNLMISRGVL